MKPVYTLAALASAAASLFTLGSINPDAQAITIYVQVMTALSFGYGTLLALAKGLR